MGKGNLTRRLSAAYEYASVRLALNYEMFYEIQADGFGREQKEESLSERFHELLGAYLNGGGDGIPENLHLLREELRREMTALTAYVDAFLIYEYVLNRLEGRFENRKLTVDDDTFTERALEYVAAARDYGVHTERISELLSQLPVRFTRSKFYAILSEYFSLYADSPAKNLEDRFYLVRSAAMLEEPDYMQESQLQLWNNLEFLRGLSFGDLPEETFRRAQTVLQESSSALTDLMDVYHLLENLVNDLYVMALTGNQALRDLGTESKVKQILSTARELFLQKDFSCGETLAEQLSGLEGVQEQAFERYFAAAPAEDEISEKVDLLLSDSTFVSLDAAHTEKADDRLLTRAEVDERVERLTQEFSQLFTGMEKPVMRAVMARVLSECPIRFRTMDEVETYIRGSLDSCPDFGEKEICKELLLKLME